MQIYSINISDVGTSTVFDKPKIAAINDVVKTLLEEAFGNLVEVFSIIPPGADPHTFSLTPDIIDKIAKSDLIVLIDPRYFGFEAAIIQNDKIAGKPYLSARNYTLFGWRYLSIPGIEKNFHGAWLDVRNAISIVRAVEKFLVKNFPSVSDKISAKVEKFYFIENQVLKYLENVSKTSELWKIGALVALPSVSYVLAMLNISIKDYLLLEPDQYPSYSKISEIREMIAGGEIGLIVVPEEFRGSRVAQLVDEVSRGYNVRIVYIYVFTASNLGSFTNLILYDSNKIIFSIGSTSKEYASSESLYLYILIGILLIISILEGLMIFLHKREESKGI